MFLLYRWLRLEHDRARGLLSAYLDNEVSPAERARIERHLDACQACRHDLETLRWSVGLTRQVEHVPLPRAFTLAPAQAAAPSAPPARRAGLYDLLRGATALTAVLLLLVVGADLLTGRSGPPGTDSVAAPAGLPAKPFAAAPPAGSPVAAGTSATAGAPAPAAVQAPTASRAASAELSARAPTPAPPVEPRNQPAQPPLSPATSPASRLQPLELVLGGLLAILLVSLLAAHWARPRSS